MEEASTPQAPAEKPVTKITTVHEESEALAAMLAEAAVARGAIQEHASNAATKCADIEAGRIFVEKTRGELDAQLVVFRDAVTAAQQYLEAIKALATEAANAQSAANGSTTQITEVKAQASAALQSMQTLLTTVTESAGRVEALKVSAEQVQSVIAEKSKHIEDAREHADKVRSELDRALTEANQSANNAEGQHKASRDVVDNLNAIHTAAQTVKANTDSNADAVSKLRQQCEEHTTTTRKLAETAENTERRVAEYEARLADFEKAAAAHLKQIESLLPGATSAGLASAFDRRRVFFKWPQRIWQAVFVVSLLALLALGVVDTIMLSKAGEALTIERLSISILHRLPIALPLIWLAFHASHKAALAQRVEEDYAFKETVSRSFEGFRREMAELSEKAAPESALARLCEGVLNVITNPPGRIYERHRLNKTPLDAVAEAAVPIAKAASKLNITIENK